MDGQRSVGLFREIRGDTVCSCPNDRGGASSLKLKI